MNASIVVRFWQGSAYKYYFIWHEPNATTMVSESHLAMFSIYFVILAVILTTFSYYMKCVIIVRFNYIPTMFDGMSGREDDETTTSGEADQDVDTTDGEDGFIDKWQETDARLKAAGVEAIDVAHIENETRTRIFANDRIKDKIKAVRNLENDPAQEEILIAGARARAAQMEAELRSEHDPLTGLLNLKGLRLALEELEQKARKKPRIDAQKRKTDAPRALVEVESPFPFSLIFFDLDKFKTINDTYGHEVADKLLLAIVKRLSKRLRLNDGDKFARRSGDEFMVVVPNANGFAPKVANDLRALVADTPFVIEHEGMTHTIRTTISLGVSAYHKETGNLDSLISRADLAANQTKRGNVDRGIAGRNHVWVHREGADGKDEYWPYPEDKTPGH